MLAPSSTHDHGQASRRNNRTMRTCAGADAAAMVEVENRMYESATASGMVTDNPAKRSDMDSGAVEVVNE